MERREKHRDDRDYDQTQLREGGHGKTLARDYSAHFFRWSFARRFIDVSQTVLEVGCGQDRPLSKILTGGAAPHVARYVGVDLNPVKSSDSQRLNFHGEFNFVERYKELLVGEHAKGFDTVVHFEVIEHMRVEFGHKLLKASFNSLKPGGQLLMSTPCYDGVHHAANHIHEWEIPELQTAVEKAGFEVASRFGTFINIKEIGRATPGLDGFLDKEQAKRINDCVKVVKAGLEEYFDSDAISCFFAPLYPEQARNNLWVCRKPA